MWQGGVKVKRLNVTDVIKELDISKSYLYKLIDKKIFLFREAIQEDTFGMKIQLKL